FGFLFLPALIHAFYRQLDRALPKDSDQQADPWRSRTPKVKDSFLDVLKMNVKIWSLFQFININYVPQKYECCSCAACLLLWNIYVAIKRR
uniref:Anoctamin n=1 Tax=Macrostomum lignano TaxID=282301 RepID=A0A1I8FC04_9PLAT